MGCAGHIWPLLPKDHGREASGAELAIEKGPQNQQNNFPFLKLEGVCTLPRQDKGRISSQQKEKQHKATSRCQEAKKPFSSFTPGSGFGHSGGGCGADAVQLCSTLHSSACAWAQLSPLLLQL